MTACAAEAAAGARPDADPIRPENRFSITADGSYAARLAPVGAGGWCPERWTLDGPEPYAVRLPGARPETADAQVMPLADGRVLIVRRDGERHTCALLYPTGPDTGEVVLGAITCPRLELLPPTPDGLLAYGLVRTERVTEVWRVMGGAYGPEQVAEVPGRCGGGVWLDRAGRLLAVDRWEPEDARGDLPPATGRTPGGHGVVRTVVVDLAREGAVSPLLQIGPCSNDRLLMADPDSGLLLVRSDAPGEERLGWGVLGSERPVRFPEVLHPHGVRLTPFALQPGQVLLPESCSVALRVEGPGGHWLALWRPDLGALRQFAAPQGWLGGTGLWSPEGELRVPYATHTTPCGVARLASTEAEGVVEAGTGAVAGPKAGAEAEPPRGGHDGAAPDIPAAPPAADDTPPEAAPTAPAPRGAAQGPSGPAVTAPGLSPLTVVPGSPTSGPATVPLAPVPGGIAARVGGAAAHTGMFVVPDAVRGPHPEESAQERGGVRIAKGPGGAGPGVFRPLETGGPAGHRTGAVYVRVPRGPEGGKGGRSGKDGKGARTAPATLVSGPYRIPPGQARPADPSPQASGPGETPPPRTSGPGETPSPARGEEVPSLEVSGRSGRRTVHSRLTGSAIEVTGGGTSADIPADTAEAAPQQPAARPVPLQQAPMAQPPQPGGPGDRREEQQEPQPQP